MTFEVFKKNWKRYLWSSLVTFLAGFSIALLSEIDSISFESLRSGAVLGVLFIPVRAGIKAVLEIIVIRLTKK